MPVYLDKLMRGNSTIRQLIEDHLRREVPRFIDVARVQWNLTPEQLPYPKDYSASDPMEALDYPFCGSYSTGADEFNRVDVTPSISATYNAVYETAIFVATETALLGTDDAGIQVWETPERYSAMRQRDDLMAIIRSTLLNTPSLGTADDLTTDTRANVREETIRESYPEPVKIGDARNPRWVCSGVINVNINLSESTITPLAGVAEEMALDMYKLSLQTTIE